MSEYLNSAAELVMRRANLDTPSYQTVSHLLSLIKGRKLTIHLLRMKLILATIQFTPNHLIFA